jgi:hypothetical protein
MSGSVVQKVGSLMMTWGTGAGGVAGGGRRGDVRGHSSSDSLRDLELDCCLGGGGQGRSFGVHCSREKKMCGLELE